jgi:hypothetical protein
MSGTDPRILDESLRNWRKHLPDDFAVFLPEGRGITPCVYNLVVGLHQQKYTYRTLGRQCSFQWAGVSTPRPLGDLPSFSSKNPLTLERIQELILRMMQSGGSKTLRSGALAKSAGVSPDTIRHYERIGVLPRASRTETNYRIYPASALESVLVVQKGTPHRIHAGRTGRGLESS